LAHGRSIDTSMGLTPCGGAVMGTRSGDLDPGVIVHLVRETKLDARQLEELVNLRSGLRGVSSISSDLRELRAAAPDNPDAQLAIDLFVHGVRKQIAAMAATLGGIDALAFTGGIGENDAQARAAICAGLSFLGVELDHAANDANARAIGTRGCAAYVLPARESRVMARHVRTMLGQQPERPAFH
jgi:acetate kinase